MDDLEQKRIEQMQKSKSQEERRNSLGSITDLLDVSFCSEKKCRLVCVLRMGVNSCNFKVNSLL